MRCGEMNGLVKQIGLEMGHEVSVFGPGCQERGHYKETSDVGVNSS